jgi:hypothetical protein
MINGDVDRRGHRRAHQHSRDQQSLMASDRDDFYAPGFAFIASIASSKLFAVVQAAEIR